LLRQILQNAAYDIKYTIETPVGQQIITKVKIHFCPKQYALGTLLQEYLSICLIAS